MTCVAIAVGVLMDNILYCTRIAYLVLCCNVKTLTLMDVNMSLEQETLNIMVVKINGFTVVCPQTLTNNVYTPGNILLFHFVVDYFAFQILRSSL